MSNLEKLDKQTRMLAAMAYGEASLQNSADEMRAIASVLVRQRDARGYDSIITFANNDKAFSFVVTDGNVRYKRLLQASEDQIANDPAMNAAWAAAKNALSGGPDLSNSAYFWDGADIKSNYKSHFKVRQGIRFSEVSHNVYNIAESSALVIKTKTIIKKKKGKIISKTMVEEGRYDHIYVSTAAFGGTIFWKFNPAYISLMHAKEYK